MVDRYLVTKDMQSDRERVTWKDASTVKEQQYWFLELPMSAGYEIQVPQGWDFPVQPMRVSYYTALSRKFSTCVMAVAPPKPEKKGFEFL
jgi:hypothetical protein